MTLNLASASLAALLLVVVLSCLTRLNIGFIAIALSWVLGSAAGLSPNEIIAGWPSSLFLTLAGVTLLFTQAEVNGSLERVAALVTRLAGGNAAWVVVLFFILSATLSSVGAGALSTAALAAPLAMRSASRTGISPLLMAVIVGNGANAGNLSPLSAMGAIVDQNLQKIGMGHEVWHVYRNQLFSHIVISAVVLVLLGGREIFTRKCTGDESKRIDWQWQHLLTLGVIAALMVGVLFFKVPVGLGAFAAATVLTVCKAASESTVVAKMPWGILFMVSGMSVLVAMLERTGGLDLFSAAIARFSNPVTVTGVVALVTGLVSAYSSTSGVVLPAFLPMAAKLVQQVGGGDPVAIISSICLGSHLVDVSPLSTIGAMCIAAAGEDVDKQVLFRQLLIWGLSMSVVGAIASLVLFGGGLL